MQEAIYHMRTEVRHSLNKFGKKDIHWKQENNRTYEYIRLDSIASAHEQ